MPASELNAPQDDDSVMIIDPPVVRKLSNVTYEESNSKKVFIT